MTGFSPLHCKFASARGHVSSSGEVLACYMRYADGITEVLLPIQAEAHQHGIRLRLRAMWMDGMNMADNSNTKSIPRGVILLQVNVI